MKHFTTVDTQSFVLFSVFTSLKRNATEMLLDAMDLDCNANLRSALGDYDLRLLETFENGSDNTAVSLLDFAHVFIFSGSRYTNPWSTALANMLQPAQFRVLVEARKWYREIWKQCQNCNLKFWSRTSDFSYVNLNRGKSVVFIDAHHWVE